MKDFAFVEIKTVPFITKMLLKNYIIIFLFLFFH